MNPKKHKYPDLKNQKSVSTTFQKGEILSDNGDMWIDDAIRDLSEHIIGKSITDDRRIVTHKFKITITKL